MEGGKEEVRKGRRRRGDLQPPTPQTLPLPVQTVVALICSISTITGSASSLVVIRVIFTRTEEPREQQREREKKKRKVRKAFCCNTKMLTLMIITKMKGEKKECFAFEKIQKKWN